MNRKLYVLSIVLSLVVLAAVILYLGGSLSFFLNIESFLFVLIIILPFTLMTYGFKNFLKFHNLPFSETEIDESLLNKAISCFSLLRKNLIAAGVIGATIGIVVMLGNLEDRYSVGPALAYALITLFYSFLLQLLWVNPLLTLMKKNKQQISQ